MASLGTYYALCPLIDIKSILGISDDISKGFVIATLGRNISSRYKISDQKQISCWRTKEKFSSPVLYSQNHSKYLAVFNKSYIKMWDAEDNLDKAKKYKFDKPIYTIISDGESVFVIFQNGGIFKLEDALEQRKNITSEDSISGEIEDVLYRKLNTEFYIGLIIETEDKYLYWTKYSNVNTKSKFQKLRLVRVNLSYRGCAFHAVKDTMNLLTCWSDGTILTSILNIYDKNQSVGDLFTVIESISMKYTLSVLSLDDNYIALYGADCNEEGAVLIIYNTQFRVTQSKQPFKLFTNNAKLWCIENNLYLPVGQNLAVIPFHLESEQLATLVGSHKLVHNELDADVSIVNELEIFSWDQKYKLTKKKCVGIFTEKIEEMVKHGLPENLIFDQLILDILENHNINLLSLCLKKFSDIPEKYLAKILKFLLMEESKFFKSEKCDLTKLPLSLQPLERIVLINKIFSRSFTEVLLIPHMRKELTLEDVSALLNYICSLWSEEADLRAMNIFISDAKILQWSCALIDSNFQKIVLSKNISILHILNELNLRVSEHIKSLEDLKHVEPLLISFKNGTFLNRDVNTNMKYSIEQIHLY